MPKHVRQLSVLGAVALTASLVLTPAPGSADPDRDGDREGGDEPTIAEVERRLGDLQHKAEIASEDLNLAREELKDARRDLRTIEGDLARKRRQVETLRAEVVGDAVGDYQSSSELSTATTMLLSDDPAEFMDDLATNEVIREQESALLGRLIREQKELSVQEGQAEILLDEVADQEAELADRKDELDERAADAQELLDDLKAEQRQRILERQATQEAAQPSRSGVDRVSDAPVSDVPASGRASVAVQTALAQVGDPYVYGAAGPDAFDCSGLTMYAWRAAGVSLPHASGMQPGAGTPVSISELMPGDLVFYYSPISHVGMYIGDGMIVHAANPSVPVQVVPLNMMPVTMAVRVG
jgi:cell wall-associated NlpC family hydrolase